MPTRSRCPGSNRRPQQSAGEPCSPPSRRAMAVTSRHFYSRLPAPPDRRRGYSILQLQKFGARIGVNLSLIEPEGVTIAGECSERQSLASYFSKLENLVAAGRPVI